MPFRFVILAAAALAALAACGGGHESTGGPATETRQPEPVTTTRPPSLGCDVAVMCFPELAREALERCPANGLDAEGQAARRRLERLVARTAEVDLHNERAYEASDATLAALEAFEQACR